MDPDAKTDSPASEGSDDRALDTLAAVLRSWGELVIAMPHREPEQITADFEGWARHAVLASPRPGRDDETSTRSAERDWNGIARFVREYRKSEHDYVTRSLADLRQIIWTFVQALGNAIVEDRNADREVEASLGALREAVDSNDTERLKQEALSSITLIESRIRGRKQREKGQLEDLSSRLDSLASELVAVKEKLGLDSLTQVPNRAALDEQVGRVVSLGLVLSQPAILFMIDVDHFKWVNDRYGHATGDEVLRRVSARLAHTFRRKGDFLARYGGDEFAAVLLEDSLEIADQIGERLLYGIRDLEIVVEGEENPIRVTVSVGAARLEPGEDAQAWFDRADRALYQAKERGRDRVDIAIPASHEAAPKPGKAEG